MDLCFFIPDGIRKNPEFPSGATEGWRKGRGGASGKASGPQVVVHVEQLYVYLTGLPRKLRFSSTWKKRHENKSSHLIPWFIGEEITLEKG